MKKTWTAADVLAVMPKGMSDFQIKNFVVGAQMTPMRQLYQAAMEIEARESNLVQSDFEEKKQKLKIRIAQEKLKLTDDPLLQAELELEILTLENKLAGIAKEVVRMNAELKSFYEVVDHFNAHIDIDDMLSMRDTLEIDYWVKRLSKQAALDLICTGRISNGNLAAMMDLPDEIFQISLKETYKLANMLAQNVPAPGLVGPSDEEFLLKFGPDSRKEIDATSQAPTED